MSKQIKYQLTSNGWKIVSPCKLNTLYSSKEHG